MAKKSTWQVEITDSRGDVFSIVNGDWSDMPDRARKRLANAIKFAHTHLSVWVEQRRVFEEGVRGGQQ